MNKKKFTGSLLLGTLLVAGATACSEQEDIVYKINYYLDAETAYTYSEVNPLEALKLPTNPTKAGYDFIGWSTNKDTLEVNFSPDTVLTGNLNVYAAWHQLPGQVANFKYNKTKKVISWAASTVPTGSVEYILTIEKDGEALDPITLEACEYEVTLPGEYSCKIVAHEKGTTYSNSAVSTCTFEIARPTYTIKFYDGNSLVDTVALSSDNSIEMPKNPTKQDAKFEGWYLDSAYETAFNQSKPISAFDESKISNQTVSVYAKWTYKDAAPVAPVTYYQSAKASGSQKVFWSDNQENIKEYKVEICNAIGATVESFTTSEKEVVLSADKYQVGQFYFVKIKAVSTKVWDEKNIESEVSSSSFKYEVVAQASYTVRYMIDESTTYTQLNVTEGESVTLPNNPSKDGYNFVKWVVNTTSGEEFTSSYEVNNSLSVYAVWEKLPYLPVAPSANYQSAKEGEDQKISWSDSTTGVKEYVISVKNSSGEVVQSYKGLDKEIVLSDEYTIGQTYTVTIKTVLNETFHEANVESEVKSSTFVYSVVAFDSYKITYMVDATTPFTVGSVSEHESVVLPTSTPTKTGYAFVKWVTELDGTVEFNSSSEVTGDVVVYAMWEVKPTIPTAPQVYYNAAKANGTQKLVWSDSTENVDKYIVTVKTVGGETVGQPVEVAAASAKEVVLDATLFTDNTNYICEIKTVLTTLYHGEAVVSEVRSSSFSYRVIPYDVLNVVFHVDGENSNVFDTKTVQEGNNVSLPVSNPSKEGYIFNGWVDKNGNAFSVENITENTHVYASYVAKPAQVASVTYTDDACKLTFNYEGAKEFQYKIDDGNFITTTDSFVVLHGLAKGEHDIVIRACKHIESLDADYYSEDATLKFTVTDIYVGVSVDGVVSYVKANSSNKITFAAPSKDGYQFIKFSKENSLTGSTVNLSRDTFTKTGVIYAVFAEKPAQVDHNSLSFNETEGTLSWTAIEGATYQVYLAGNNLGITETNSIKISDFITASGSYEVKIQTIIKDSDVGELKSDMMIHNYQIELSTKTVYSDDGNMIKQITSAGTTYVLFAGQSYIFPSAVSYTPNDAYFEVSGTIVKMKGEEEIIGEQFDLTYVDNKGNTITRKCQIQPQVLSLGYGGSYGAYKTKQQTSAFLNSTNSYTVGVYVDEPKDNKYDNLNDYNGKFYFDLDMVFGSGYKYEDTTIDFNYSVKVDGNFVDLATTGLGVGKDGNRYYLSYTSTAATVVNGKEVSVIFTPRYLNKTQYNKTYSSDTLIDPTTTAGTSSLAYTFVANTGVNVNTHEQLKAAFADNSAAIINIHAETGTIEAQLAADQLNADGSPVNLNKPIVSVNYDEWNNSVDKGTHPISANFNTGVKKNADVYSRSGANPDSFTVHGNYVTIDASKLPTVDGSLALAGYNADLTMDRNDIGYTIQRVQLAVMAFIDTDPNTASASKMNVSDIQIIGNTDVKGATQTEVEKYSGGYNGIGCYATTDNLNNISVSNTGIAIYYTADKPMYDNHSQINQCKVDRTYACGVYLYGTSCLEVTKSYFGISSDAAIHIEDRSYYSETYVDDAKQNPHPYYLETKGQNVERFDPCLAIDTDTRIENWTDGSGAYFASYGFGTMVPMFTADTGDAKNPGGLQGVIHLGMGTSILKKQADNSTKFNLKFMFSPFSSYSQCEFVILNSDGTVKNQWTYAGGQNSDEFSTDEGEVLNANASPKFSDQALYSGGQMLLNINDFVDGSFFRQLQASIEAYTTGYTTYKATAGTVALTEEQEAAKQFILSLDTLLASMSENAGRQIIGGINQIVDGVITAPGVPSNDQMNAIKDQIAANVAPNVETIIKGLEYMVPGYTFGSGDEASQTYALYYDFSSASGKKGPSSLIIWFGYGSYDSWMPTE